MKVMIFCLMAGFVAVEDRPRFSAVELEKPFSRYLLANPLLMEVTGAKIIRLGDGRKVVLGVASTALKDRSARDLLRAEKVCRIKALASVVAEKQGVQVAREEKLVEETTVVVEAVQETGQSVSSLLEITSTRVEGIARDMPVVGSWRSLDGEVYYLAIGVVLGKNGEPIARD